MNDYLDASFGPAPRLDGAPPLLRASGVTRAFGPTVALDGFGLDLDDGVLLALLGPSGCGKTTALRVIAGFERPDSGEVWVRDRLVAGRRAWVAPERRRIGMVFQDWALFPHLDVWHNVSFGLAKGEDYRAHDVLEMVGLDHLRNRMPHELSGGQQQRVALARALAPQPDVVLLDEPFSNLDASLRARVRSEVRSVLREAKATAIFVTHDQEEALSVADRLAVMDEGRVLQVGSPHEVYRSPRFRRVAELVGDANIVPARIDREQAYTELGSFPAPGRANGLTEVLFRPESVVVERDAEGNGVIIEEEFYGHDQSVRAHLDGGVVVEARLLGPHPELEVGIRVRVGISGTPHFFPLEPRVESVSL